MSTTVVKLHEENADVESIPCMEQDIEAISSSSTHYKDMSVIDSLQSLQHTFQTKSRRQQTICCFSFCLTLIMGALFVVWFAGTLHEYASSYGPCRDRAFDPPEQIHIALGATPDTVTITYQTWDYPVMRTANVRIGSSPTALNRSVRGQTHLFTDPNSEHINRTMHVVQISNLSAATTYYYQVGDDAFGWNEELFSFKTILDTDSMKDNLPQKFLVFGDMGTTDNLALQSFVYEAVYQHNVDALIHVGDLGYNLDSDQGRVGDEFMNQIQNVAAYTPYMVCPGNHELAHAFSHYSQRFRGQPSNSGTVHTTSGKTPNNWYYSFNAGLVHFVAISTEIYFYSPHYIEKQYKWIEADLLEANENRADTPWIVVYGHRPLYCSTSNEGDCGVDAELVRNGKYNETTQQYEYGLEDLFYEQGVDLYFCGHEHHYERMYDIYKGNTTKSTTDMPATTYVVTAAAGSVQGKDGFGVLDNEWTARKTTNYSYTRFYVYNASHARLQQITADLSLSNDQNQIAIDQVWYVQHHHGPFDQLDSNATDYL